MTQSYNQWIETLVQMMPVAQVARLTGIHRHTIKAIDYRRLKREQIEPDWSSIRGLITIIKNSDMEEGRTFNTDKAAG